MLNFIPVYSESGGVVCTVCRSGGIGRRARLKIVYCNKCEGSIPSSGTIKRD